MIELTPGAIPERDVFTELDANEAVLRRAAARRVELIARACDTWQVDETAAFEGAERHRRGGADGTAHVGEFLCVELAGRLRCSVARASEMIADTLNLRDRHPHLWRAVLDLRIESWQATRITRECARAGLSAGAARWVDAQVSVALQLMGPARILRALPRWIAQADPALAADRAERARAERCARVVEYRDGCGTFFARLDAAAAVALDETLSDLANALAASGDTDTVEQRRATALGLLAEPGRAASVLAGGEPGPSQRIVKVFVHLPAGSVVGGEGCIAQVEGVGALTRESLVEFLGTSRLTVQPVVDFNQVPASDSYAVPPLMAEAVRQRNPVEAFPWSHKASRTCELDHTVPFSFRAPPGARQTNPGNLAPLGKRVHRAKTHGGIEVQQLEEGVLLWTSKMGYQYLVTPRGTHDLGRRRSGEAADKPVLVDFVYPAA